MSATRWGSVASWLPATKGTRFRVRQSKRAGVYSRACAQLISCPAMSVVRETRSATGCERACRASVDPTRPHTFAMAIAIAIGSSRPALQPSGCATRMSLIGLCCNYFRTSPAIAGGPHSSFCMSEFSVSPDRRFAQCRPGVGKTPRGEVSNNRPAESTLSASKYGLQSVHQLCAGFRPNAAPKWARR